jgi:hypothetical protein
VPTAPVESAIFGPILSASEIEEATIETLKFWFPTYLGELERRLNLRRGILIVPQNYTNRNSFDAVEGEKTPKVVVIAPGLDAEPLKNSTSYRATWRVGVGLATGAKTERDCNKFVKAYAAAARAILIHKPGTLVDYGLPHLDEVNWLSEEYTDLADISNQHRLYKAATLWFAFDINAVTARRLGPTGPDAPDLQPPDFGDIETVIIHVDSPVQPIP